MNFEMMCKLVDSIVENEYNNVIDSDFINDSEIEKEYKELTSERNIIEKKLNDILSEEQKELTIKVIDLLTQEFIIEEKQLFKSGVGRGLNQLKYLNDYNLGFLLNRN